MAANKNQTLEFQIMRDDQESYNFDVDTSRKETKIKVVKVVVNKTLERLALGAFVLAIIVAVYDKIKDVMRWVSGMRDVMKPSSFQQSQLGYMKLMGATKDNYTRFLWQAGFVAAAIILWYTRISKSEVAVGDVPKDVQVRANAKLKELSDGSLVIVFA